MAAALSLPFFLASQRPSDQTALRCHLWTTSLPQAGLLGQPLGHQPWVAPNTGILVGAVGKRLVLSACLSPGGLIRASPDRAGVPGTFCQEASQMAQGQGLSAESRK